MSDLRTVCGLWVVEGTTLLSTSNFSWQTKIAEEDGRDDEVAAEMFVRVELMQEVGQTVGTPTGYRMPTDVMIGPQHNGHLTRETYFHDGGTDLLSLSDPAVPDALINRESVVGPDDLRQWTVCGITRWSNDLVCWEAVVSNPLMAYYQAYEAVFNRTGQPMLLCGVHPGFVGSI